MKRTIHRIHFRDSRETFPLDSESVDLVLTSPPYPMIEMWDELFSVFPEKFKKIFLSIPIFPTNKCISNWIRYGRNRFAF
ncbi:hypothetical protein LEP1GSC083_1275 [Leptospira interrogans serovar Pyrogenes str. L0374]|uniref:site-specific DNA-methyltransferase (cytosine-N(4)-specific) n=1 Tax=Leptospira interrogans serovar Pyrogenes str. L0374 TaxID=1049928 RepID=M6KCS2_LEPIR|nr:hypothetical protein LEP1GSC083_1275 [Leptospira interrogans serovar Pyrogenes str. L0374]